MRRSLTGFALAARAAQRLDPEPDEHDRADDLQREERRLRDGHERGHAERRQQRPACDADHVADDRAERRRHAAATARRTISAVAGPGVRVSASAIGMNAQGIRVRIRRCRSRSLAAPRDDPGRCCARLDGDPVAAADHARAVTAVASTRLAAALRGRARAARGHARARSTTASTTLARRPSRGSRPSRCSTCSPASATCARPRRHSSRCARSAISPTRTGPRHTPSPGRAAATGGTRRTTSHLTEPGSDLGASASRSGTLFAPTRRLPPSTSAGSVGPRS